MAPLKYVVDRITEKSESDELPYIGLENITSWTSRLHSPDSQHGDGMCSVFRPGDVLFGKLRPYLAKVWLADRAGRCTSEALVLRTHGAHDNYIRYILVSHPFINLVDASTYGAKMPRAEWGFIGNIEVPIPFSRTQRRIADFLDRKTAAIDELIAKKEQLVKLLAEKRQALITQAVTKGLDPNVPMKDSGFEWVGCAPAHWTVSKLGLLLRRIEQGWSPQCIGRPPETGDWGVLKAGAVNTGELDELESKALPPDLDPPLALEVRSGDVLMSRASGSRLYVGSVGIVRETSSRLLLCDKLYRLDLDKSRADPEFVVAVLRTPGARQLIDAAATGQSTLRNIGQDFVRSMVFAWPPSAEQVRIREHIATVVVPIHEAQKSVATQVHRLREYRKALITAAVTGQLDVSAADDLPETLEQAEAQTA